MNRKVIVTGTSGFIGSHLVNHLHKTFDVYAIDRNEPLEAIKEQSEKIYVQDINDGLPFLKDVYAVVHLAAKAGVRNSDKEFNSYVKDNIIGTKAVLDMCVNTWKPNRCLITSSSSVYGDGVEPCNPKSPYALTKFMNEEMIRMYNEIGLIKDSNYSIIRPFTVYGEGQREDLAISKFITAALEDEPCIIFGDGYQSRDFTYIEDVCRAIKLLLYPVRYLYNGYDIGTCKSYNLLDTINLISDIIGKELSIKFEESNIYDVEKTCANVGNLYETIGYIPNTPFRKGLESQIEWMKNEL